MDELFIEAKLENMNAVLDFVNARLVNCNSKIQNQIGVAVDEIFSNISRYAYNSDDNKVMVRITIDSEITIIFEDNGSEYNPLDQLAPDISLSIDERDIGGLGIFMVKNMMDYIEYKREAHKNILIIKKKNEQKNNIMNMDITKKEEMGTFVLVLNGRLGADTAPQLETALSAAFEETNIVCLDCTNLAYVSSAGLRILLYGAKTAKQNGGVMTLKNVSADIIDILNMTGFYEQFEYIIEGSKRLHWR